MVTLKEQEKDYIYLYMLMFIKKNESLKAKITLNLSSLEI